MMRKFLNFSLRKKSLLIGFLFVLFTFVVSFGVYTSVAIANSTITYSYEKRLESTYNYGEKLVVPVLLTAQPHLMQTTALSFISLPQWVQNFASSLKQLPQCTQNIIFSFPWYTPVYLLYKTSIPLSA